VKFEEFKRQFQLRRREAQQEHDELSTESEAILKEYKSLVELGELFFAYYTMFMSSEDTTSTMTYEVI